MFYSNVLTATTIICELSWWQLFESLIVLGKEEYTILSDNDEKVDWLKGTFSAPMESIKHSLSSVFVFVA